MSVHQFLSREALFSPSDGAVPLALGQEGKSILHKECTKLKCSEFLPTKITLWTNASRLDTFCRNIWHAKQGKVLCGGSKFFRNKEMAVRALVACHVAWHGRRDWLRPGKYSRHVRSGTSPFAGFLKWRPESAPEAG